VPRCTSPASSVGSHGASEQQLDADKTGTPTDCASVDAMTCKPVRAQINGKAKDGLLDDCLSDVLAYQGQSRAISSVRWWPKLTELANRQAMTIAVGRRERSLGSKIVFDALTTMLNSSEAPMRRRPPRAVKAPGHRLHGGESAADSRARRPESR